MDTNTIYHKIRASVTTEIMENGGNKMDIIKRNGQPEPYESGKIQNAILCAFDSVNQNPDQIKIDGIMKRVEAKVEASVKGQCPLSVELIQDMVEQSLMEDGCYEALKSFILYRNERSREREVRQNLLRYFADMPDMESVLKEIQKKWTGSPYWLEHLLMKFSAFYKQGMTEKEKLSALIQAAVELTTQEAPDWEYIAARILMLRFKKDLAFMEEKYQIKGFYDKLRFLTSQQLYGDYILGSYTREELEICEKFIDEKREQLFTYSGLELLLSRYVIRSQDNIALESPQEMFLGIALHLAMLEKNDRLCWVKRFYDMLSTLKVTMATPTLSNARKIGRAHV